MLKINAKVYVQKRNNAIAKGLYSRVKCLTTHTRSYHQRYRTICSIALDICVDALDNWRRMELTSDSPSTCRAQQQSLGMYKRHHFRLKGTLFSSCNTPYLIWLDMQTNNVPTEIFIGGNRIEDISS